MIYSSKLELGGSLVVAGIGATLAVLGAKAASQAPANFRSEVQLTDQYVHVQHISEACLQAVRDQEYSIAGTDINLSETLPNDIGSKCANVSFLQISNLVQQVDNEAHERSLEKAGPIGVVGGLAVAGIAIGAPLIKSSRRTNRSPQLTPARK